MALSLHSVYGPAGTVTFRISCRQPTIMSPSVGPRTDNGGIFDLREVAWSFDTVSVVYHTFDTATINVEIVVTEGVDPDNVGREAYALDAVVELLNAMEIITMDISFVAAEMGPGADWDAGANASPIADTDAGSGSDSDSDSTSDSGSDSTSDSDSWGCLDSEGYWGSDSELGEDADETDEFQNADYEDGVAADILIHLRSQSLRRLRAPFSRILRLIPLRFPSLETLVLTDRGRSEPPRIIDTLARSVKSPTLSRICFHSHEKCICWDRFNNGRYMYLSARHHDKFRHKFLNIRKTLAARQQPPKETQVAALGIMYMAENVPPALPLEVWHKVWGFLGLRREQVDRAAKLGTKGATLAARAAAMAHLNGREFGGALEAWLVDEGFGPLGEVKAEVFAAQVNYGAGQGGDAAAQEDGGDDGDLYDVGDSDAGEGAGASASEGT